MTDYKHDHTISRSRLKCPPLKCSTAFLPLSWRVLSLYICDYRSAYYRATLKKKTSYPCILNITFTWPLCARYSKTVIHELIFASDNDAKSMHTTLIQWSDWLSRISHMVRILPDSSLSRTLAIFRAIFTYLWGNEKLHNLCYAVNNSRALSSQRILVVYLRLLQLRMIIPNFGNAKGVARSKEFERWLHQCF